MNWDEKYIINFTVRREGSSRFGAENQFHNFGSVAGAWIFSNESFIKNNISFLSFGKLRASYGATGNDQIGDYKFLSLYSYISSPTAYQGTTGLEPTGLPNPYLQWEETRKLQFGVDVGLFTDRIILNLNYYRNRSSNQLLEYALPVITGFEGIRNNFSALVQNSGWELSLSTMNVGSKNFKWRSSINLTIPKNKLIEFPWLNTSSYANLLVIGEPITIQRAFRFLRVDPATGVYEFSDKNGGPTTSPDFSTDRTIIINTAPKFYGGFSNNFQFKGFELDFLFQFVKQIGSNYFFGNRPGQFFGTSNTGNQPGSIMQRWQKPGDERPIQKVVSNSSLVQQVSNAIASDAAYSDASFIRLKNVSLSWQMPEKWRQKAQLQNARIFIQGQNLLTITNYQGLDPETKSSTTLPPLRILTVGVQVTL